MAIYSLRMTAVGKTTQKAPFTAAAHLKYITRKTAVTHVMAARMPDVRRQAVAWLKQQEREDRKNARVIDKLVLALPRELSKDHRHALVKAFAEELTRGRASWFAAFHTAGKDRDNPHCHLILRDRDVETGKRVMGLSAGVKEAALRAAKGQSAPTNLAAIRALWERCANAALQVAGRTERIDRRSLKEQGLARPAQVHEGPNIRAMHARGVRPASRDRVVAGRRGRGRSAARVVRYATIDKGLTRVEYNASIRQGERVAVEAGRDAGRAEVSSRRAVPASATQSRDRSAVTPATSLTQALYAQEASAPARPEYGSAAEAQRNADAMRAVNRVPTLTEKMAPGLGVSPPKPNSKSLTAQLRKSGGPSLPLPESSSLASVRSMATNDTIVNEIAAARAAYNNADARLVTACEVLFADPHAGANELLNIAEEFGAAHAVERLNRDPEAIASLRLDVGEPLPVGPSKAIEEAIESVLEAQDQMDLATSKREKELLAAEPGRPQVISIRGKEFALHINRLELRSVAEPSERHALPPEMMPVRDATGASAPSLTQAAAREQGVAPAQPRDVGNRGRGR